MLHYPIVESRGDVWSLGARVDLDLVEFDLTILNVLGSGRCELSLLGQLEEGLILDLENECVPLHIVVQGKKPIKFVVLHVQRKHTLL